MMKVILSEKMEKLGNLGDIISVKSGYARNALLPKGLALLATAENIKKMELLKEKEATNTQQKIAIAKQKAEQIASLELVFELEANENGSLFGSVGVADILGQLQAKEIEIEKKHIQLSSGPIKQVGEHLVDIVFHSEVHQSIKVTIKSNQDALEPATEDGE